MSTLILRLSSLGDVILSSTALEACKDGSSLSWATLSEYGCLFEQHPKLSSVYLYDRKTSLKGWIQFSRQLWKCQFDQVIDLHCSVRSRLMRLLFFFWDLSEFRSGANWKVIAKERWKLNGFLIFKAMWPKGLRPIPWIVRFARMAGGSGSERPDLTHLLRPFKDADLPAELLDLSSQSIRKYLCIMPSSKWAGKQWPLVHYVEWISKSPLFPVIFGTGADQASIDLCRQLDEKKIPYLSGVGKWSLNQAAFILSRSQGYFGGDTGLAHLAEAVGKPAHVVFGPTSSAQGFGPWRPESRAFEKQLWCRPCGKDGRRCYRPARKYLCLTDLSSSEISEPL